MPVNTSKPKNRRIYSILALIIMPLLLIGIIMAAPGRVASGEWRVASYKYAVLDAGYSPSAPARPAAASLVGHVTIQGHPAQPSPLQSVPLTVTLNSADCNGTASD